MSFCTKSVFVRTGLKSLPGTNTSLSQKLVNYGRKKFCIIGPGLTTAPPVPKPRHLVSAVSDASANAAESLSADSPKPSLRIRSSSLTIHDKRSAAEEIAQVNAAYPSFECLYQGILKGEITLYHWPPDWLVWNYLYDNWQFLFLFA